MTLEDIFSFKRNLGLSETDQISIMNESIRVYFHSNTVELTIRLDGYMSINSQCSNLRLDHLEAHARAFEFIKNLNLPAPKTEG
jgi:hypothetical protein